MNTVAFIITCPASLALNMNFESGHAPGLNATLVSIISIALNYDCTSCWTLYIMNEVDIGLAGSRAMG